MLQIILLITGIFLLAKGKISVSAHRQLSGWPARFLGSALITCSVIAAVCPPFGPEGGGPTIIMLIVAATSVSIGVLYSTPKS